MTLLMNNPLVSAKPRRSEDALWRAASELFADVLVDPMAALRDDPCLVFAPLNAEADPWQRSVLTSSAEKLLLLCSRQSGKALDIDTPIPTPTGWTSMGALEIGDSVIDEMGNPTKVIGCSELEYREAYEVSFSDGSVIIADGDHQWNTIDLATKNAMLRAHGTIVENWAGWKSVWKNGSQLKVNTLTTNGIADTLKKGKCQENNHAIPACRPLDLPEADLPIDPYVLGAWLGDGTSCSAQFTTMDDEITMEIAKAGYNVSQPRMKPGSQAYIFTIGGIDGSKVCRRGHPKAEHWHKGHCRKCERLRRRSGKSDAWTNIELIAVLRRENLLNNKHIPDKYLRASFQQRLALFQGLMDTDGCGSSNPNNSRCEFTSTNPMLAAGFLELSRSLGIIATMSEGRAKMNGKDCGPKWRIGFTPTIMPFRLTRKKATVNLDGGRQGQRRLRYIVGIKPVGKRIVKCITVDSPNCLYLAGESMIPTHNSFTLAAMALLEALLHPHSEVLLISKTLRQSAELLLKVKMLWRGLIGGKVHRRPWNPKSLAEDAAHEQGMIKAKGWDGAALVGIEVSEATKDKALSMELPNGSRIISLPGSPDTIVGFSSVTLLVLDEASRIPDQLYNLVRPFQAATKAVHGRAPRLVVASTPYGKRGWFWEAWQNCEKAEQAYERGRRATDDVDIRVRGAAGNGTAGGIPISGYVRDGERVVSVVVPRASEVAPRSQGPYTGTESWLNRHYQLGAEGKEARPPFETYRVTADQCPRIEASFLEEERAMIGNRWYRQEYFCEFVDAIDSVFSRDAVQAAVVKGDGEKRLWFE